MKAIELLTWLLEESVDTEGMAIVEIDEDFDYEAYFGYQPDTAVPVGKYAYLYGDMVLDCDIDRLKGKADGIYTITTDLQDRKNEKECIIYLLKLED